MLKANVKKGQLREELVRRSARSVRTPARVAEEALPIVSVDDLSDASGDDCLHQHIAELQDQPYSGFGVYANVYVECHPLCGLGACHSAFRQVTGTDARILFPTHHAT